MYGKLEKQTKETKQEVSNSKPWLEHNLTKNKLYTIWYNLNQHASYLSNNQYNYALNKPVLIPSQYYYYDRRQYYYVQYHSIAAD